jgi:hypothetical protein
VCLGRCHRAMLLQLRESAHSSGWRSDRSLRRTPLCRLSHDASATIPSRPASPPPLHLPALLFSSSLCSISGPIVALSGAPSPAPFCPLRRWTRLTLSRCLRSSTPSYRCSSLSLRRTRPMR